MKQFAWTGGILVLLSLSLSYHASAQGKAQAKDPCGNVITQFEMNQCAAKEYQKADAALNRVYKQVMDKSSLEEKVKLKTAQLAWIKFRDAECDYESAENIGGTIYPLIHSGCLTTMTELRIKQLREHLANKLDQ